ncbi:hypothetical protein CHARACLAT_007112 [Characodon lateralis]|uniref:Uncharacterized protein n=1 Tax=Characodon lateralis TaxID=208331 RepID=A0ABU7DEW4_9TELE|nr:hypothetical protein [Characodon lateralis]
MCTLPSTFNLFFILLSELNRRLLGGYPGWPRWLRSNTNYVFKDLPRIIPATTQTGLGGFVQTLTTFSRTFQGLYRRLLGGYLGWPRWLRSNTNYVFKDHPRIIPATTWRLTRLAPVASFRISLDPRISRGRIFHTHLPDTKLWNFPGWLLPDPDSPKTVQPNLSTLHLSTDASPAFHALTQVTKKSSDLPLTPYSLLLQSESLSSWRIAYALLLFLHTIPIHSP